MKFANIYYPYGSLYKKEEGILETINIGDVFQYLSIVNLYRYMEIDTKMIVNINRYDLKSYDGEYVILPINCLFSGYTFQFEVTNFSPKIIPVFLGFAIKSSKLSNKDIHYLKKYEPIGCRDEYTLNILRNYGITAWLNGCMTITFSKKNTKMGEKVFFIDTPESLDKYIPEGLNVERLTHIKENDYEKMELKVMEIYERYKSEAILIVTSRLHCALPCIAAGIPTIVVRKEYESTFSWVEKITKLYTEKEFDKIDWSPKSINCEEIKEKILDNAKNRIMYEYKKYSSSFDISSYYENRKRIVTGNKALEKTINMLKERFEKSNVNISYAIWGVSLITDEIVDYAKEYCPMAKLVAVFDKYREFNYYGLKTQKIENIDTYEGIHIIVTGGAACEAVRKKLEVLDFSKNIFWLCY